MILVNHFASDGDDVGRIHSHRGEGKDSVDSDDRCENEETHESCESVEMSALRKTEERTRKETHQR